MSDIIYNIELLQLTYTIHVRYMINWESIYSLNIYLSDIICTYIPVWYTEFRTPFNKDIDSQFTIYLTCTIYVKCNNYMLHDAAAALVRTDIGENKSMSYNLNGNKKIYTSEVLLLYGQFSRKQAGTLYNI